jgi:hypothetical protein
VDLAEGWVGTLIHAEFLHRQQLPTFSTPDFEKLGGFLDGIG